MKLIGIGASGLFWIAMGLDSPERILNNLVMNIIPITKFRVDTSEFNTEEEARAYIKSKTDAQIHLNHNIELLNEAAKHCPYVPTTDSEGGLRLFSKRYNNFDQGMGYEDILGREHLKYVESELKILSSKEFIDGFMHLADTLFIYADESAALISALKAHLLEYFEGENTSQILAIYANLLDALGKVQYAPVYAND
jgi:hypothetical protein